MELRHADKVPIALVAKIDIIRGNGFPVEGAPAKCSSKSKARKIAEAPFMARRDWTRDELILAFNLYCKTPFGKIHIRNPDVIALATAIGRTPSAVSWKLANFARLDPPLQERKVSGTALARNSMSGMSSAKTGKGLHLRASASCQNFSAVTLKLCVRRLRFPKGKPVRPQFAHESIRAFSGPQF
jgi:hypothetical protein